ncbi:M17 family metallopeptidase [endosymbiont GvMRE of Glomus versiforme]|uniref:M17 family metallopeptidase n=1 Tax=endosymbiont GvMRE of Glomus versiforme TaxID=2039283 RepID=UPI000EDEAFFE|nr:peptidase M17 [endosymbiont GvMRE of Glomus versiforme]RHZ36440.1 Leucyl aminopeptidase [endosymbiont GvMRE of Glomus versiforme]
MTSFLHIQDKKQKDLLTLKAITEKEKFPSLVEKKDSKLTLISEEETYYLYLNKQAEDYNFHKIYNFFVNFSQENERNLNIDVKSFVTPNLKEEIILQAIIEGTLFGGYSSATYKTDKKKLKIVDYHLITTNKQAWDIWMNSFIKLAAVNFARGLQDIPPNELHAKEFAEMVKKIFSTSYHEELSGKVIQITESKNKLAVAKKVRETQKILSGRLDQVEVEILDKKKIEKNKMGLLLAVNAGSHHEPRVVILRYFGDKNNKKNVLGLIGKGITFDSGGYDLKSSQHLQCMKFDMSGAAAVCASFFGLIQKSPKINVVAVACLTENAIGGHATLTESVVKSMNGKTVEINNTDAEGRLVLADGITYAIREEKATKIITVATLTGAVVAALGENLTGVLTNDRKFYREFRQAFAKSQERYWELPIIPENTKALKENTSIADISNISSSRYMGASNGAAFLQEFVEKLPFIHCDIAGTAWKTKTKRGTGIMVKTLIEFMLIEKNNSGKK